MYNLDIPGYIGSTPYSIFSWLCRISSLFLQL